MKNKNVVLLAGLPPIELGRAQEILGENGATKIRTAYKKPEALSRIRENPEIAVVCVDFLGPEILKEIADTGYKGKVIPATNCGRLMRTSGNYIYVALRDIPEAVNRALGL